MDEDDNNTQSTMGTLSKLLLIENFGPETTIDDLNKCFGPALKQCGVQTRPQIQLAVDKKGRSLCYASVISPLSKVELFLNFDGWYINGHRIKVTLSDRHDVSTKWQSTKSGVFMTSPLRVPVVLPADMNIIDAGIYLTHPSHKTPEDVLTLAAKCGVDKMVTLGTSVHDSQEGLNLCRLFCGTIFCTAGVNARGAVYWTDQTTTQLEEVARCAECVAIGVCGLNLTSDDLISSCDLQLEAFQKQIQLAIKLGKPLLVSDQSSSEEILSILEVHKQQLGKVAIFGRPKDRDAFNQYLEKGFYYIVCGDIIGEVTPKESMLYQWMETNQQSEYINQFLVASQAPYSLAPKNLKLKGQRHLRKVIETLATCFNMEETEMTDKIRENTKTFYSQQLLTEEKQDGCGPGRQTIEDVSSESRETVENVNSELRKKIEKVRSESSDIKDKEQIQTNWTYRIMLYLAFFAGLAAMYFFHE